MFHFIQIQSMPSHVVNLLMVIWIMEALKKKTNMRVINFIGKLLMTNVYSIDSAILNCSKTLKINVEAMCDMSPSV